MLHVRLAEHLDYAHFPCSRCIALRAMPQSDLSAIGRVSCCYIQAPPRKTSSALYRRWRMMLDKHARLGLTDVCAYEAGPWQV